MNTQTTILITVKETAILHSSKKTRKCENFMYVSKQENNIGQVEAVTHMMPGD